MEDKICPVWNALIATGGNAFKLMEDIMSEMTLTITEDTLKKLILDYISSNFGIQEPMDNKNIQILVKSKQNYRSNFFT